MVVSQVVSCGALMSSCRCRAVGTDVLQTALLDVDVAWTGVVPSWGAALAPVLACIVDCGCGRACVIHNILVRCNWCVWSCVDHDDVDMQVLRWVALEQRTTADLVRRRLLAGVSLTVVCGLDLRRQKYMFRSSMVLDILKNSFSAVLDTRGAFVGVRRLAYFAVHVLAKFSMGTLRCCSPALSGIDTRSRASLAFLAIHVALDGVARSGILRKQPGNIGERGEAWTVFRKCVTSVIQMLDSTAPETNLSGIAVREGSLSNIIDWCLNATGKLFSTNYAVNNEFVEAASYAADTLYELSIGPACRMMTSCQSKQLWDSSMEMFRAFAKPQGRPPSIVLRISERLILSLRGKVIVGFRVTSDADVTGMMTLLHWSCCQVLSRETRSMATFLHAMVRCSHFSDSWFCAFYRAFRYEHLSQDWLWAMQVFLCDILDSSLRSRSAPSSHRVEWKRTESIELLAKRTTHLFPVSTALHLAMTTATARCMAEVARQPWLCLCAVFAMVRVRSS